MVADEEASVWTALWSEELEDALHVRDEAHVQHTVGLVDGRRVLDAGSSGILPRSNQSRRRPGVAIRTSPLSRAASLVAHADAPIRSAMVRFKCRPSVSKLSEIWVASVRASRLR
jgi:hypothetical protein